MKTNPNLKLKVSIFEQDPDQQQCSKDDISCKSEQPTVSVKFDEEAYNNYEHAEITSREDFLIHKELDEIDAIRKGTFSLNFKLFLKS